MEEYKFKQRASRIQELLDKTEAMPSAADVNAMKQSMDTHVMLPANYIADEEGIYRREPSNGKVYPVIHPDLSTQPSILPQRFGTLTVYEVLIAYGREYEIPSDAVVIEASSFNGQACVPAIVTKDNTGKWSIINREGITPDFTLVRYHGKGDNYYYSGS